MMQKSVRAIYCDDIRTETHGKLSYMGVYNSDMVVPSFPTTLTKLSAFVTVNVPSTERPKKNVHVRLLNGEQTLAEVHIDEAALAEAALPQTDTEVPLEEKWLSFAFAFVISPFQVQEAATIRLRADVDGEEFKGNALKVRLATEEESKNMSLR